MILLFLLILAAYSPIWSVDYIYHDELFFFFKNTGPGGGFVMLDKALGHGRFLLGFVLSFAGWCMHSIEDLRWMRLGNVLLIGLLGAMLFPLFARILRERLHALLAVFILLTLPSFALVASRAWTVHAPLAMVLALGAALLAVRGRVWAGAILLLCALSVYQSGVMMFVPVAFLILRADMEDVRGDIKLRAKNMAMAAVAALFVYALMLVASSFWLGPLTRGGLYDPLRFGVDLGAKLTWFMKEPLSNVLSLWQIHPGRILWPQFLIWLVCAVACLFIVGQRPKQKSLQQIFLTALLMLGALALSFLPGLLMRDEAPFYRCLGPLTVMVFCPVLIVLYKLMGRWPRHYRSAVLAILALYGGWQANTTVLERRVLPSMQESVYVRQILSVLDTGRYDGLVVNRLHALRPERYAQTRAVYDEWGTLTLDFKQNAFMYAILAREQGWIRQVFPYVLTRTGSEPVEYCVVRGALDGAGGFKEAGSRGYWPRRVLPDGNGLVEYVKHRSDAYMITRQGPDPAGNNILLDISDLTRSW